MTVASETQIINFALRALGGRRITSLSDGSNNANAASDLYEMVRDQVLRSHNWNFAISRVELAELAAVPDFGFDHQHALPSDWIRTVSVHDNDAGLGGLEYKEETTGTQRVILTNSATVYLRYVSKITDTTLYPADFVVALAIELAKRLAIAIPGSNTIKADLDEDVRRLVLGAKSTDAMGSTPERRPPGSWVSARFGWPSNRWPR